MNTEVIGYVVLAKRPDRHNQDQYRYDTAGGVWPDIEPVENHQAYSQMAAEADPNRYGDVEYVIAALTEVSA